MSPTLCKYIKQCNRLVLLVISSLKLCADRFELKCISTGAFIYYHLKLTKSWLRPIWQAISLSDPHLFYKNNLHLKYFTSVLDTAKVMMIAVAIDDNLWTQMTRNRIRPRACSVWMLLAKKKNGNVKSEGQSGDAVIQNRCEKKLVLQHQVGFERWSTPPRRAHFCSFGRCFR